MLNEFIQMKIKLLLFLFLFFVLASCNKSLYKKAVGYMENDKFITTSLKDSILTVWNADLETNKMNGRIDNLEIKLGKDEYKNKPYYYLFGHSKNDSIKMGALLQLKRGKFYFLKDDNTTVICSGCANSYPKYEFDDWGWGCDSKELNTDCKKTVIVKY